MNGIPQKVTVSLKDLTPSTSYTFEFAAESDAGEGPARPMTRNTPAPREYIAGLVMELLPGDKIHVIQLHFWPIFEKEKVK